MVVFFVAGSSDSNFPEYIKTPTAYNRMEYKRKGGGMASNDRFVTLEKHNCMPVLK